MFWMVLVPGHGNPKRVHTSLESAQAAVRALKAKGVTREIHILQSVYTEPGRKILRIRDGQGTQTLKVEAAQEANS